MSKKKKSQIENKDLSDDVAKITGDELAKLKDKLMQMTYSTLLKDTSLAPSDWIKKQHSYEQDLTKQVKNVVKEEGSKIANSVGEGLEMVDVSKKAISKAQNTVNKGIQKLGGLVINTYQNNVASISTTLFKSNVAEPLFNQVKDVITKSENYGVVVYKDGKKFRWENYMEMKVRTDIQQDIGKSMVENGLKMGNIFYICSYHGDCAPDHKDSQGKIYVDKNWKSAVTNDELVAKIEAYISSHQVKTIQEIMGPQVYLTTRPNCRHYFQYIAVDDVLKIKTNDDLNKKREELNLNSRGKYKPEKYEALKKQRYNERKIRAIKGKIETQKKIADSIPNGANKANEEAKTRLLNAKLREAQKDQRDLIKEANKNEVVLDRNYNREVYNKMMSDLGASKLTNGSNGGNIENEEMFREETLDRSKYSFISKDTFNNFMKDAEAKGITYLQNEEVEEHLNKYGAGAATIYNIMFFRKDVTISEVLEEMHHAEQNLNKLNDDKEAPLRSILNEIETKEYLLKISEKFKIPKLEVEETKKQLEEYKKALEDYYNE